MQRDPVQVCKSLAAYLQQQSPEHAYQALRQVQVGLQTILDPGQPKGHTGPVVPDGTIPAKKAWRGLRIDIENPKGTMRQGVGPTGIPWQTYMFFDYGYIRKTEGEDGDAVDVYLGPDLDTAKQVYVVHQLMAPGFATYDEDKCMLGFPNEETARRAYLAQYDKPDYLGTIEAFDTDAFVKHVKEHGKAPGSVPDNYLTDEKLMQRLVEKFDVAFKQALLPEVL